MDPLGQVPDADRALRQERVELRDVDCGPPSRFRNDDTYR